MTIYPQGTPVISPPSGAYTAPLTVTVSDSSLSVGQAVYYSTAGDPELVSGATYAMTLPVSFSLSTSSSVYARVYDDSIGWGILASAAYIIQAAQPTYTVTYDGNGGAGAPPSDNSSYKTGDTVTVLGPGSLVKSGCTFNGWNTAANGSGTTYQPNDTFLTSSCMPYGRPMEVAPRTPPSVRSRPSSTRMSATLNITPMCR